jgi:hypothetical protein
MRFEYACNESKHVTQKSQQWHADIGEYSVIFVDRDGYTELSIYRKGQSVVRLGIVTMHPRSVEDLETFGREAPELFSEIAQGLREAGKSDLRGKHQIFQDELDKKMEELRSDIK